MDINQTFSEAIYICFLLFVAGRADGILQISLSCLHRSRHCEANNNEANIESKQQKDKNITELHHPAWFHSFKASTILWRLYFNISSERGFLNFVFMEWADRRKLYHMFSNIINKDSFFLIFFLRKVTFSVPPNFIRSFLIQCSLYIDQTYLISFKIQLRINLEVNHRW